MADIGKNAHTRLYDTLHSHYNCLRHDRSGQPSRYYIPDSLTSLNADEFLTCPVRLFQDESLHVKFLSGSSESFSLGKLMVIAIFSFHDYEYFLQRTLELLPDLSDGHLPLRDNPAPGDERYTKCFDVFFWNQYLFYESDGFLDLVHRVVARISATQHVPADAQSYEGVSGKVYAVRTAEDLGLQEGAYVHKKHPSLILKVYHPRSPSHFDRERLFWHNIDSYQSGSSLSPFTHPHILRPLLFWRCTHEIAFAIIPSATCDLALLMMIATWREQLKSALGGFRWLVTQLKGLVDALDAVHNPAGGNPDGSSQAGEEGGSGQRRGNQQGKIVVGYHWNIKPENILFTSPRHTGNPSSTGNASQAATTSYALGSSVPASQPFTSQSRTPILQLTNFSCSGITTFLPHQSPETNIPNTTPMYNTDYRPPESILGDRNCGRDYDIWSLGGVMLEILVWWFHGYGTPTQGTASTSTSMAQAGVRRSTKKRPPPLTLLAFREKRLAEIAPNPRSISTSTAGSTNIDSRSASFFTKSPNREGAVLLPSVLRVRQEIFRTATSGDFRTTMEESPERVQALSKLLDILVDGMLVVERKKRLSAREVGRRIGELLGSGHC
ncbi:hypothetical protein B0T20DRAFT_193206 [Sordaria brevicollis]|uniref:Protein kinase domain-containing protein n=1 Tax=Sordaria brevicollis TaxID=83679 RepID=A0AAE0UCL2_SORBR|nr:hypothetical protein B0T20DRAFT_193206 [Sordaria brevicollis]